MIIFDYHRTCASSENAGDKDAETYKSSRLSGPCQRYHHARPASDSENTELAESDAGVHLHLRQRDPCAQSSGADPQYGQLGARRHNDLFVTCSMVPPPSVREVSESRLTSHEIRFACFAP